MPKLSDLSTILGPRADPSVKVKQAKKEDMKEDSKEEKGKEEGKKNDAKKKEDEKKKRAEKGSSGQSRSGSGRGSSWDGGSDDPDGHLRYVEGYAGYLAPMILTLSRTSERSPVIICSALAILFMAIHVALPIFTAAHYSCLITLIVPAQSTLKLLRAELHPAKKPRPKESEPKLSDEDADDDEKKDAFEGAHDAWEKRDDKRKIEEETYKESKEAKVAAGQWLLYWLLYSGASLARGYVAIVRPGWKGWFEVWRTVALLIAGGPWFSPSALL